MGLYANYIFPRVLEFLMSRPQMTAERRRALTDISGEVLEIGFGTGLNLPHYPDTVERLTVIDPARMLPNRVDQRIAEACMPVERVQLDAAHLPFDAARFDCVVSTWTLCSIDDIDSALREIARVLKPGGSFLFLEHGRSDEPKTARRQDRLNPLWRKIGVGCNLNRPIDQLVRSAGLEIVDLERYLMPNTPRMLGEHYLGRATVA